MTKLSININKIALLRNSRGRNYPDVQAFAARCLDLGAHGITLHPRQDQRHARYSDVESLAVLCKERGRELNVEGYPSEEFLDVVKRCRPEQCTLVPDAPGQLTSDHGWDIPREHAQLSKIIPQLNQLGITVSLFMDFDSPDFALARQIGADRIELYTEPYAEHFGTQQGEQILEQFRAAAARAKLAGLGVNAGHDLSLENLANFLQIPHILEVSIGHAVIVESIEFGLENTLTRYLEIINQAAANHSVIPA
jgi:pyridoxine 5-phosphate synthase